MNYERRYAWSVLLRLYHWAFALSIVVLVATGLYIAHPWTTTYLEGSAGGFPMANIRYVHFVAGFIFTSAVMVRLFLLIFGNRQERFWNFTPITIKNIKNLFSTMFFYMYLTDKHEHRLGHNVLAGCFYIITLFLAIFQIISGFYLLYPQSTFWQKWGFAIFGTQQEARFCHHMFMWYFILFALIHIYIVVWNDIKSPEGLISSIFNGHKFLPKASSKIK